ncbi:MAG: hypothetical protein HOL04_03250 [Gammaproteobacteria bacterium]|jgi:hypothetical protein|nr:hypothetical protein [Gammaproteobacteria bacterium]MBT4605861.1 hypothetical protein [Thiotrichales bacterium]MBT3471561.1 hypothetical protein [Gammaproteobacteria bacterium]MBT3967879.1 hypothetical protein [Gammaproteobacteria bacterium]MBT4081561.1 hypothetical protein [Gammaproteobacteria bacterium]
MDMKNRVLKPLLLVASFWLLATGCQQQREQIVPPQPAVVEQKPVVEPSQQQQIEQKQAERVERARWKREAEEKAKLARKAEEKLRVQKLQQQRVEKRKAEVAKKKAKKEQAKRERAEKKEKLKTLLLGIERSLDKGGLQQAEQQMEEYRALKGESALRQTEFQALRQRVIAMRQVFADLDQAKAAEQYLKQLINEAQRLKKRGDIEAARGKYGEVLLQDPANRAALKGLEVLSQPQQVAAPIPKVKVKKKEKKSTSLLGKKAPGWVVQVATYHEDGKKEAYALLGAMKKAGFRAVFVKKQQLVGRTLYRIRVGAYSDKQEAVEVGQKIDQKMAEKGIKVAGRVMKQK